MRSILTVVPTAPPCRRRALLGAAALLIALALAPPVHAADGSADKAAKTAAKAKLEEGARLMDAGDYAQALADFEEAYKLVKNPKIQFNIGLANIGLARYPDAIRALEQFMTEAKNASSTTIADAQKQIDALRPKVATVEVAASEPGIDIVIDGRPQGKTPITVRIYVEPGQHRLLAQKSETAQPVVQAFTVAGGERQTVRVTLPEAVAVGATAAVAGAALTTAPNLVTLPGAEEAAAGQRPVYKKAWFWTVLGGGAVAGAVTALLLLHRSPSDPTPSLGTVSGQ